MQDLFHTQLPQISNKKHSNISTQITKNSLIFLKLIIGSFLISISLLILGEFVEYKYFSQDNLIKNTKKVSTNVFSNEILTTIYPPNESQITFPQYDDYFAKSIAVLDLNTNTIIYEKNSKQAQLIASLTKMVTTKVLYDNINLDHLTTIDEIAEQYNGSSLVLNHGEIFTNRDLLKAAIISSNNQVMYAIQDPQKTVENANAYVKALRLENTHISNPAGFDDDGQNYSSAQDLLHIAKIFFANPVLKDFASMEKTDIKELKSNRELRINNTNDLLKLKYPQVIAGKTGTTAKAGQNLCLLIQKNNKRYIIVILRSTDRYKDAIKIIERI